ncbi:MAG: tyrosine-protein phosphatase [Deltaproteobacteria bacterium]|nr:tyrosine-protein phosphatase [Deltaproteobacteria bacterium]MBW2415628.1 tyrosine-protein phosphatase [Deltaproteobacteria bacterium]
MPDRPPGRPAAALAALLAVAALGSGCARLAYNFGTIEEGRVYRSAQPSPFFLRWLRSGPEIRTLINLRGDTPGWESAFAARNKMRLFVFNLSASRPPTEHDVERFLGILRDDANYPLLVHCRNGVDRTGYMLALYRVQEQGWDADRAASEMNRFWQFSWFNDVPQKVVKQGLRRPAKPRP